MQFIDLHRQYDRIADDMGRRINEVLRDKQFIMGPQIKELEERLAAFVGRKYCLACASGTDALIIPLMAYQLKETDAVFVPSFTFYASAESVNLAGGTPVFVDSDTTYNIDPKALREAIENVKREGRLTPRGIIPVDLFGLAADYDAILQIADEYGLFVLEDAAQGFGGSQNGKKNGSFGQVAATSFFPAKPLGCYGDGGAIFTDDDSLYSLMHSIRVHGQGSDRYDNVRIGVNGRMDTLQAAVLLSKLAIFEQEMESRQRIAQAYRAQLDGAFELPVITQNSVSAWAQFTLMANSQASRDSIVSGMKAKGIPIMIYYPIPLHMQTAYRYLNYRSGDLPVCEDMARRVFSVPMHPYLEDAEIEHICAELKALA